MLLRFSVLIISCFLLTGPAGASTVSAPEPTARFASVRAAIPSDSGEGELDAVLRAQPSQALLLVSSDLWVPRDQNPSTVLMNEPDQPLYFFIGYILMVGLFVRLALSQRVHKFFENIYDPLIW